MTVDVRSPRSRIEKSATIACLAVSIFSCVGLMFLDPVETTALDGFVFSGLLATWLGGTAHVATARAGCHAPASPPDPALLARARMYRRRQARTMLITDPELAAELHIGRPDLPRHYDDGGLVDVNHVPAATLITELDLSPATAVTVVAERNRLGGFTSADEMLVYCAAVNPTRLALIRDRLVFVPL
jgi:hypothetical protein